MQSYLELVEDVLENGVVRHDRTGVGTKASFGRQLRFDLRAGFPICTTKKVRYKSVVRELLWLLSGSTNVKDLHPCKIWDAWADENGDLGPVYGAQWRNFGGRSVLDPGQVQDSQTQGIDQISGVIRSLKEHPYSRRHIVSAWNPVDLEEMALPPCHAFFQFFVHEDNGQKYLSCQLYQRSADLALGVPFNIASYATLTHMIAQQAGMVPYEFVHTFGDVHIYLNHVDGLREQLERQPRKLPTLNLKKRESIDSYELSDFKLENYDFAPAINFPIAV